jgi:hypothetical protein
MKKLLLLVTVAFLSMTAFAGKPASNSLHIKSNNALEVKHKFATKKEAKSNSFFISFVSTDCGDWMVTDAETGRLVDLTLLEYFDIQKWINDNICSMPWISRL